MKMKDLFQLSKNNFKNYKKIRRKIKKVKK